MIFKSFKNGDEIHDRIVDALINKEIEYFTESDIYSIKDNYLYVINPEQLKYDKEIKTKTDFPESSAIPLEEYDEEKVKSNPIEQ